MGLQTNEKRDLRGSYIGQQVLHTSSSGWQTLNTPSSSPLRGGVRASLGSRQRLKGDATAPVLQV